MIPRKRGGIVIYSARTRQYEPLADFGFEAIWMSDGRRLIFTNQGEGTLFIVDVRTKDVREILKVPPDDIRTVGLSRDERSCTWRVR